MGFLRNDSDCIRQLISRTEDEMPPRACNSRNQNHNNHETMYLEMSPLTPARPSVGGMYGGTFPKR